MAEWPMTLLEIDLATKTSKKTDVGTIVKDRLPGNGLGLKLLWDLVPAGTDALDPKNIFHIGTGPLTGLIGCKTSCTFKSPLVDWAGEATLSSELGLEIIQTGNTCGILLKGKAATPSYVFVYDDKVEVRDATDLWGKLRFEVETTLQDRIFKETGLHASVLSIGPAGQNLVRIANVMSGMHSGSKFGGGAVMGSKNVIAVVVKGTKTPPYADHAKVYALWQAYATSPVTAVYRTGEARWGHSRSLQSCIDNCVDPSKNQHDVWDGASAAFKDSYRFHNHDLREHIWTTACPGCASACWTPYLQRGPRGIFGGEYRHGQTAGEGANWLLDGFTLSETSAWLAEYGMDGEEAGCIAGWAMDLAAQGYLTAAQFGGTAPKYGDIDSILGFLKNVALRSNATCTTFGEGFPRAAAEFDKLPAVGGKKASWWGWFVQGQGSPRYDVRQKTGGSPSKGYGSGGGGGAGDAVVACSFAQTPFATLLGGTNQAYVAYWNAAVGWALTTTDITTMSRRDALQQRCYAMREGLRPAKDYVLPPRAFDEPVTDKYGNTWVWTKAEWDTYLSSAYSKTLGLTATGLPKESELTTLGLTDCITALKPLGLLG